MAKGRRTGLTMNPERMAWRDMKYRCLDRKRQSWPRYGGRGITVCQEWIDSFDAFLAHVGKRPSPNHSLERIDVDGDYEPGNVRWATAREQANNRTNNRIFEYDGRSQTMAQWAREYGMSLPLLHFRLGRMGISEALNQPVSRHMSSLAKSKKAA